MGHGESEAPWQYLMSPASLIPVNGTESLPEAANHMTFSTIHLSECEVELILDLKRKFLDRRRSVGEGSDSEEKSDRKALAAGIVTARLVGAEINLRLLIWQCEHGRNKLLLEKETTVMIPPAEGVDEKNGSGETWFESIFPSSDESVCGGAAVCGSGCGQEGLALRFSRFTPGKQDSTLIGQQRREFGAIRKSVEDIIHRGGGFCSTGDDQDDSEDDVCEEEEDDDDDDDYDRDCDRDCDCDGKNDSGDDDFEGEKDCNSTKAPPTKVSPDPVETLLSRTTIALTTLTTSLKVRTIIDPLFTVILSTVRRKVREKLEKEARYEEQLRKEKLKLKERHFGRDIDPETFKGFGHTKISSLGIDLNLRLPPPPLPLTLDDRMDLFEEGAARLFLGGQMLKFCESRIKVFRGDDIQLPSSCEGVFRDISLVDCGGGTLAATWTSETEKFHFDYDAPADELSQSYRKRREVVIEHKLCLIDVSAGLVKWTVALEGAVEELVYGDGVLLLNYFCNTGVSLGVVRIKRRSLCAIGVRALRRYKVYAISGQVSEFVCAYRPQFVIGRGGRGGLKIGFVGGSRELVGESTVGYVDDIRFEVVEGIARMLFWGGVRPSFGRFREVSAGGPRDASTDSVVMGGTRRGISMGEGWMLIGPDLFFTRVGGGFVKRLGKEGEESFGFTHVDNCTVASVCGLKTLAVNINNGQHNLSDVIDFLVDKGTVEQAVTLGLCALTGDGDVQMLEGLHTGALEDSKIVAKVVDLICGGRCSGAEKLLSDYLRREELRPSLYSAIAKYVNRFGTVWPLKLALRFSGSGGGSLSLLRQVNSDGLNLEICAAIAEGGKKARRFLLNKFVPWETLSRTEKLSIVKLRGSRSGGELLLVRERRVMDFLAECLIGEMARGEEQLSLSMEEVEELFQALTGGGDGGDHDSEEEEVMSEELGFLLHRKRCRRLAQEMMWLFISNGEVDEEEDGELQFFVVCLLGLMKRRGGRDGERREKEMVVDRGDFLIEKDEVESCFVELLFDEVVLRVSDEQRRQLLNCCGAENRPFLAGCILGGKQGFVLQCASTLFDELRSLGERISISECESIVLGKTVFKGKRTKGRDGERERECKEETGTGLLLLLEAHVLSCTGLRQFEDAVEAAAMLVRCFQAKSSRVLPKHQQTRFLALVQRSTKLGAAALLKATLNEKRGDSDTNAQGAFTNEVIVEIAERSVGVVYQ